MKTAFFVSTLVVLTAMNAADLTAQSESASPLNVTMKNIDGEDVNLAEKYRGKVVLIVNTASKCGLTPQYKQLQELHEKYAADGLRILGFPCNQFMGQEPGSESDIKQFCQKNYGVDFDMFSKIDVKGGNQTPLYKTLTGMDLQPAGSGKISWNFEKFLLDRNGKPIARFSPRTKPDSEQVVNAIETALRSQ